MRLRSKPTRARAALDPPGKVVGMRKRTRSMDTASLSSFSSDDHSSLHSSTLHSLALAIGDTQSDHSSYMHRHPPSRRCHPIAFEIEVEGDALALQTRRRPSLWRQLYDNLSSEELQVEQDKGEGGAASNSSIEGRPAAVERKFFLSKASDGDSRVSTECHPNSQAEWLWSDAVDDLNDSDVADYIFGGSLLSNTTDDLNDSDVAECVFGSFRVVK